MVSVDHQAESSKVSHSAQQGSPRNRLLIAGDGLRLALEALLEIGVRGDMLGEDSDGDGAGRGECRGLCRPRPCRPGRSGRSRYTGRSSCLRSGPLSTAISRHAAFADLGGDGVGAEAGAGTQRHGGLEEPANYIGTAAWTGTCAGTASQKPSFFDHLPHPDHPLNPEHSEAKVASAESGFLGRPLRRRSLGQAPWAVDRHTPRLRRQIHRFITPRHIIHDWSDEDSVRILDNCRKAMQTGGRMLIVEAVVPEGNEASPAKEMDMAMLLYPGGMERTEQEYQWSWWWCPHPACTSTSTVSPLDRLRVNHRQGLAQLDRLPVRPRNHPGQHQLPGQPRAGVLSSARPRRRPCPGPLPRPDRPRAPSGPPALAAAHPGTPAESGAPTSESPLVESGRGHRRW